MAWGVRNSISTQVAAEKIPGSVPILAKLGFAGANPRAFHAADGSGYAFIRDEVIQTDKTNNQVAARLCGSFGTWKKYDKERGALMKACLEEIVATEGLSKDTFEIATRSLK